ncbi:MAG TPA: hypothetical protein VFX38_04560 [Gammaproteobacteria bacterium]|nr:hypothetical protein [Gammaproteobacteria bacterium]
MQRRIVTDRDIEILTALDRVPLTAQQMLAVSETFSHPFGSERTVRERLQAMSDAGWIRSSLYALPSSGGSPKYYFLTRQGYGILNDPEAPPPTKRHFSPLSISRQHHTKALADFLVHMLRASHRSNVRFTEFYRENTLRLTVGEESLYPDSSFQLIVENRPLNFVVEIDNHTETIRSAKDTETWERKLRLYDRLQDSIENRFRVLAITTRSTDRLRHILMTAAGVLKNPQRSLVYGIDLPTFIREEEPLHRSVFRDHFGRATALIASHFSIRRLHRAAQPAVI